MITFVIRPPQHQTYNRSVVILLETQKLFKKSYSRLAVTPYIICFSAIPYPPSCMTLHEMESYAPLPLVFYTGV